MMFCRFKDLPGDGGEVELTVFNDTSDPGIHMESLPLSFFVFVVVLRQVYNV